MWRTPGRRRGRRARGRPPERLEDRLLCLELGLPVRAGGRAVRPGSGRRRPSLRCRSPRRWHPMGSRSDRSSALQRWMDPGYAPHPQTEEAERTTAVDRASGGMRISRSTFHPRSISRDRGGGLVGEPPRGRRGGFLGGGCPEPPSALWTRGAGPGQGSPRVRRDGRQGLSSTRPTTAQRQATAFKRQGGEAGVC